MSCLKNPKDRLFFLAPDGEENQGQSEAPDQTETPGQGEETGQGQSSGTSAEPAATTTADKLYTALAAVMQCDHVVMDGEPDEAAVYRYAREDGLYESDVLILAWDVFDVLIYQREYDDGRVTACADALVAAEFLVSRRGVEVMENGYYRYALEARIRREQDV